MLLFHKHTFRRGLILSFFLFSTIHAQEETVFGKGKVRVSGIWGGSYNAYTSFEEEFNHNTGGFFTFEINKNFLLGWTGYGTDLNLSDNRTAHIGGSDFLIGYTPNSHQVLHPIFYLQAGGGKLEVTGETDDSVFILQPNLGLELNVLRWFRFGIEAGYRFVNNINVPGLTENDLSSPIIGLRLKFGFSSRNDRWYEDDWD